MPRLGGWLSCLSALLSLPALGAFSALRRPGFLSMALLHTPAHTPANPDEAALELYNRLRSYNASDPSYGA